MSMSAFARMARIALAGGLLCLAGCGGGPPWTTSQTPDSITLRWWADSRTTAAEAEQVAELHCAASGRHAALADTEQSGSAKIAHYRCR
jgi:hypothetical protein